MSATANSVHQQTRQQLDELDSLLQRMLALPSVSIEQNAHGVQGASLERIKPEDFAPLPPTLPSSTIISSLPTGDPVIHAWRIETTASTAHLPMATPVDEPIAAVPPPLLDPRLYAPPPPVAVAAGDGSTSAYPAALIFGQTQSIQAPVFSQAQPMQASGFPGVPTPQWQSPKNVAPPVPFILLPLLGFNRLFDIISYLLGPLGSFLRAPAGRNTLGWLGILMILGAIGWGVADWYGIDWTR